MGTKCQKVKSVNMKTSSSGKETVIDCRKKGNRKKCDKLILHCPTRLKDIRVAMAVAYTFLQNYKLNPKAFMRTFHLRYTTRIWTVYKPVCAKKKKYSNYAKVAIQKNAQALVKQLFLRYIRTKKTKDLVKVGTAIYAGSNISYTHFIRPLSPAEKKKCGKK